MIAFDYQSTGCGKFAYPDKKAALSQLNKIMNGHRNHHPGKLKAYHCPECGYWHIARKKRR